MADAFPRPWALWLPWSWPPSSEVGIALVWFCRCGHCGEVASQIYSVLKWPVGTWAQQAWLQSLGLWLPYCAVTDPLEAPHTPRRPRPDILYFLGGNDTCRQTEPEQGDNMENYSSLMQWWGGMRVGTTWAGTDAFTAAGKARNCTVDHNNLQNWSAYYLPSPHCHTTISGRPLDSPGADTLLPVVVQVISHVPVIMSLKEKLFLLLEGLGSGIGSTLSVRVINVLPSDKWLNI